MLKTVKDYRFSLLLVLVALLALASRRLHNQLGLAATVADYLILVVLALRVLWAVPPVIRSGRALKRAQREAAAKVQQ